MASESKAIAAAGATPKREVVKVHVRFTLNTPDGMRRVIFDLEKDKADDGAVSWKIIFQLFERAKKADPFGDAIVDLLVEVDSKLNNKAQIMADSGMTPPQAAFALGPAADAAKDPTLSEPKKQATVQTTLKR